MIPTLGPKDINSTYFRLFGTPELCAGGAAEVPGVAHWLAGSGCGALAASDF